MLTNLDTEKTFSQRLRLAALTLCLPIVLLALLPTVIIGVQEFALILSQYSGTDVTPWHLGILASSVAYTLYSLLGIHGGLKAGFGAIISAFLVFDLAPVPRGLAFLGDSITVPIAAVALASLLAIELISRGQPKTPGPRKKGGNSNDA